MHYDPQSNGRSEARHEDAPTSENTHQGDLFDQDIETPPSMTDRFLEFSHANPHVWTALRDLALEWKAEGKTKCGIALLYNVARWRLSLRTEGDGMFELNDHFQAFYARALMHFVPELDGMFNVRAAAEADAWIAQFKAQAA